MPTRYMPIGKRLALSVLFVCLLMVPFRASSQTREERLKNHVYYFASDSLQGRQAGTEYSAKAADYIISEFEQIGVVPFFDKGWKLTFTNPSYPERNFFDVVGMIPGSDPELMKELIVIGAHFDHLGVRSDGEVYNGADDNASGSAALIEIARLLKANQQNLKRSVVIAGFDAEEIGLYGSNALADVLRKNSLIPNVKLMISVDMVGWLEKGGALTLEGVATIKDGRKVLQKYASECDLSVKLKNFERSILTATDTETFAQMHVPTLAVTTGLKSPYHKVEDDADLIDYKGLDKISGYMADVVSDIASDQFFLSSGKVAPKHRNPVPAFEIAPKVGLGTSFLKFPSSSVNAKPAFSYEAGLAAKLNFSYFAFQAEGVYSVESSYFPVENDLFGSKETFKMSSVTVPAYFVLFFQDRLQRAFVGAGPYYKRVLDYSFGEEITAAPVVAPNQFGASLLFGAGIGKLTLSFNGRYQIGRFFDGDDSPKSRMITSMISLGYWF